MNRHAYVLIGNNGTGKTTIQRNLVELMCGEVYERLPSNKYAFVTNEDAPRSMKDLFVTNRSYQEKIATYGSVEGFFSNHFREASVVVLSSHANPASPEIGQLISGLKRRFYHVTGVFLENAVSPDTQTIADTQPWDDRLLLNNAIASSAEEIARNLAQASRELQSHMIRRFNSH